MQMQFCDDDCEVICVCVSHLNVFVDVYSPQEINKCSWLNKVIPYPLVSYESIHYVVEYSRFTVSATREYLNLTKLYLQLPSLDKVHHHPHFIFSPLLSCCFLITHNRSTGI